MKRYRTRFRLKCFDGINSEGNSGGLALYWHESLMVDVVFMSHRCIDAHVAMGVEGNTWRITCVHGEPGVEDHHICGHY